MTDRVISEDTIDTFVLEVYEFLQTHPRVLEDDGGNYDEGYMNFHEFIHERFDKLRSPYIKERNYN